MHFHTCYPLARQVRMSQFSGYLTRIAWDFETGTILNNLASLYDSQGKYEQAEPLYARTLAICELAMRGISVVGVLGMMLAMTEQQMRANAEFALAEAAAGVAVIGQTYPLERAAEAHAALEERQTIGKVLLIP